MGQVWQATDTQLKPVAFSPMRMPLTILDVMLRTNTPCVR